MSALQSVKNFFHHEIKTQDDASTALLATKFMELSVEHMTPDIVDLESRVKNYIFVPDEHMTLMRRHDLVACGTSGFYPYCPAYTSGEYAFVEKKLGKESFPIPFHDLNSDDLPPWMQVRRRIKGELYALRGFQFIPLDKHKLNGVQFRREKVTVNVPYFKRMRQESQSYNGTWSVDYSRTKDMLTSMEVFMYVGVKDYWMPQLSADDGVFNFSHVNKVQTDNRVWIKEYYDYKLRDI